MESKYFIKNATVVSVDKTIGNVENCDVLIEGTFISAVGPNLNIPADCTVIDGTNAIVSPGFVDTHRHTWQTQLRTITTDYVLADYLLALRHIYGSCYSAHDAYMGNYCGALESIDNGITYLIDHSHIMNSPDHADSAVKGLMDSRIRAAFCYVLYTNPPWEGSYVDKKREEETPNWRLDDAQRIQKKFFPTDDLGHLVRFGFGPSEAEITPPEQVAKEIQTARAFGAKLITAHVGMGQYDPGNATVRKMAQHGVLASDLVLSHATTLQEDELDAVKKYGVGLSSTPDTELQMGMGHPIAFKAKDHGCNASLGVDICSNSPADMFQQMRLLLQSQRYLQNEQNPKAPLKVARKCADILEMATMGGANAVGLGDVIGSVTPGKRADLIMTRCDSPRLVPVHDPVGALVLYANGSDIDTVFINGVVVKSEGKLTGVDWPKVRGELRLSTASIMERAKRAPIDELQAAKDAIVKMLS